MPFCQKPRILGLGILREFSTFWPQKVSKTFEIFEVGADFNILAKNPPGQPSAGLHPRPHPRFWSKRGLFGSILAHFLTKNPVSGAFLGFLGSKRDHFWAFFWSKTPSIGVFRGFLGHFWVSAKMAKISERWGFWSFLAKKGGIFGPFFGQKGPRDGVFGFFGVIFWPKTPRRICAILRKSCKVPKTPSLDDF